MNRKLNLTTTLIMLIALNANAYSPELPSTSLLSPNATELGKYGEIPMSPYTGIPKVEIPVYEIQTGDHKVPITLRYHAGGLMVNQRAGWVGTGWTLNAGGSISRIINSMNDEADLKNWKGGIPLIDVNEIGYYYKHKLLNYDWTSSASVKNKLNSMANDWAAYRDTAPDRFMFNFMGYSGNFYMNDKGEWQVQCDHNIKVEFGGQSEDFTMAYAQDSDFFTTEGTNFYRYGTSHSFKTFTLTDEMGIKYVFGGDDNAIEFAIDFFDQGMNGSMFYANTWNLSKIIYPDRREVSFEYQRADFTCQLYHASYSQEIRNTSTGGSMVRCPLALTDKSLFYGMLLVPSYLKTIKWGFYEMNFDISPSSEIDYDYSDIFQRMGISFGRFRDDILPILINNGEYEQTRGAPNFPDCLGALKWHKLDNIEIKYRGRKERSIGFSYTNNAKSRLALTYVFTRNGESYYFEYYDMDKVPGYEFNKHDRWGYYNGREYSLNNTSNSSFEPNPDVAHYGMLKLIDYPTDGYTRFEYEGNQYSRAVNKTRTGFDEFSTPRYTGGVRLRKIINSATGKQEDEIVAKEYFYVRDFQKYGNNSKLSSGVLLHLNDYTKDYEIVSTGNMRFEISYSGYHSVMPFTPNTNRNHIGYSEVVEMYPDKSFTIYKYSNFDNGYIDEQAVASIQKLCPFMPYSSKDQDRGLLLERKDYNAGKQLTKAISYEYERSSSDYVKCMNFHFETLCDNATSSYHDGIAYKHYTYTNRLSKMSEIDEYGFKTSMSFNYDADGNIYKKVRTEGNKTYTTKSYYPVTYQYIDNSNIYKTMMNRHLTGLLLKETKELTTNGKTTLLYNLEKSYSEYTAKISSLKLSYGDSLKTKHKKYVYNRQFNIIEESDNNAPTINYLWANDGNRLIAIFSGFKESDYYRFSVHSQLFNNEMYIEPNYDQIDAVIKTYPHVDACYIKYDELGRISEVISPSGLSTKYGYDFMSRLTHIYDTHGELMELYEYNYLYPH